MLRVLLALLIIVVLASCCCAQGKITSDPNAPAARAAEDADKDASAPDERVAQKISYEAIRRPLREVLAELTEKTGVSFRAGENLKDWQVRDRKVNVFVKDVPLAAVMNSMARTLMLKWGREEKDGVITYRLFMNKKTRDEAQQRVTSEDEKIEKERQAKREKAIAAFSDAADITDPVALEKLRKENPIAYFANTSGISQPLKQFLGSTPVAAEAMLNGTELSLGPNQLSAGAQAQLMKLLQSLKRVESLFRGGGVTPDDVRGGPDQLSLSINANRDMMRGGRGGPAMMGGPLATIRIRCGDQTADLPMFDTESPMSKAMGEALVKSQEENRPLGEVMRESGSGFRDMMTRMMSERDTGEPKTEHAQDPDLDKKIKIKPEAQYMAEIQKAVSEAAEIAMISDSFGKEPLRTPLPTEETELTKLLDAIADGYYYNWEHKTPVIEWRDREWYRRLFAMIPDEWLERWRESFKTRGYLEIGEVAEMAALSVEQVRMNIQGDDVLGQSGMWRLFRDRELLKLYNGLTESQRDQLFTAEGLDLKALPSEQWEVAQKFINRWDPSITHNPEAHAVLTCVRTQSGKNVAYEFLGKPTEGSRGYDSSLEMPVYDPNAVASPNAGPFGRANRRPDAGPSQ